VTADTIIRIVRAGAVIDVLFNGVSRIVDEVITALGDERALELS